MQLSGVLTPIPTPLDDRDEVDPSRLRAALTRWLATPLTGFVILGSNGEAALLDRRKRGREGGTALRILEHRSARAAEALVSRMVRRALRAHQRRAHPSTCSSTCSAWLL